jgi:hypothetical protein
MKQKKHRGWDLFFITQDFQPKEMILAIILENKAPNPVSISCLKAG